MGTISLADLGKAKLHQGVPAQEERKRFKEEVVLGQDGIYLSYVSDFFDIIYKKETFSKDTVEVLKGVNVPVVEPKLTIASKIPSRLIYKMVAWYRDVNAKYGTEATMQVFYDKTAGKTDFPQELKDKYQGAIKREGKFVFVIPEQNVTGGYVTFSSTDFPQTMTKELYTWALSNYEPILNIHSHNSMGAFWSGTDDANELPLYTRLCLVIGKVHTDHPEFRFSWNFEGKRHHYEKTIDQFIQPLEMTTSIEGLGYKEVKELGFDEALGLLDFDAIEFDERWYDRIKARGRFGKYESLKNLTTDELTMTPEEELQLQHDNNSGKIKHQSLDEIYDHLEQDTFYDDDLDEDDFHGEEDELLNIQEPWKKDLMKYKEQLESKESTKDEYPHNRKTATQTGATFRPNQPNGKKRVSVYEKFKKDQIKHDKKKQKSNWQGSIWDDVE